MGYDSLAYNAVGGVGTAQGIQQSYANLVNLNNMASNLGYDNGMGFDTGIFSQYGGSLYNQYGRYPGSETQNMSLVDLDAYNAQRQKLQMIQQTELQKTQVQQQVELQKQGASVDFQIGGPDRAIKNAIGFLKDAVDENKQDEVEAAYKQVETAYRNKLKASGITLRPGATTEERKNFNDMVTANINDLYFEATKSNLVQDLKVHGDSPFWAGFKSGLDPFGWFTNSKSTEENLKRVGAPEKSKADAEVEEHTKTVGKVLGYVAMGVVIPALALATPKIFSGLAKFFRKG